jgi:hypothetical protein
MQIHTPSVGFQNRQPHLGNQPPHHGDTSRICFRPSQWCLRGALLPSKTGDRWQLPDSLARASTPCSWQTRMQPRKKISVPPLRLSYSFPMSLLVVYRVRGVLLGLRQGVGAKYATCRPQWLLSLVTKSWTTPPRDLPAPAEAGRRTPISVSPSTKPSIVACISSGLSAQHRLVRPRTSCARGRWGAGPPTPALLGQRNHPRGPVPLAPSYAPLWSTCAGTIEISEVVIGSHPLLFSPQALIAGEGEPMLRSFYPFFLNVSALLFVTDVHSRKVSMLR